MGERKAGGQTDHVFMDDDDSPPDTENEVQNKV